MASNRRGPAGALVIFATLTRVGVKETQKPDGSVHRVFWAPDEVFAPESLATLAGVPITIGHPERIDGLCMPVTPANWRTLTVGHVAGTPHRAGKFVLGEIHIQHDAAIDRVERGELLELSTGYAYDLDPTPGVFEGEPYDVVHRNIRHHHVGLGPPGFARWGPDVRLHLDDAGVTSVNRFTKQPMEQAMRYDQANAPRSYADQVAEGVLRGELALAGFDVPRNAAPAFLEGMRLAMVRGGRVVRRADSRSAHAISATIADPFRLLTATIRDGRADAALGDDGRATAGTATPEETMNSTNAQRDRMFAAMKDRWRTGRAAKPATPGDDSLKRGAIHSTEPSPSGTSQTSRGSTERVQAPSLGGNSGDPAGELGASEGMWDGAETRAAESAMFQRAKDAWKKPKRDRNGKGHKRRDYRWRKRAGPVQFTDRMSE